MCSSCTCEDENTTFVVETYLNVVFQYQNLFHGKNHIYTQTATLPEDLRKKSKNFANNENIFTVADKNNVSHQLTHIVNTIDTLKASKNIALVQSIEILL